MLSRRGRVYIKNQHTGYEELAEDHYVKLQRGDMLSIVKIRGTGQYLLTIPVTGATTDDAIAFVHEQLPRDNPAHCSLLHYLYASSKAYAAEYRANEACFQRNLPKAPQSVLSSGWTRVFLALLLIAGMGAAVILTYQSPASTPTITNTTTTTVEPTTTTTVEPTTTTTVEPTTTTTVEPTTTTTVEPTTTTTGPITTSPSSFVLECGASPFEAPLESTSVSNYTITGTGCGGSDVTVVTTQDLPIVFQGNLSAKFSIAGPAIEAMTAEVTILHPIRVTRGAWPAASSSSRKSMATTARDLGVYPTTDGASELVAQFGYGCEAGVDLETYVTADSNDSNFILDVMMPGCGALQTRNFTDGAVLSFTDIYNMFPTCVPPASPFTYPAVIRADHEAGGRFIVAILYGEYYCLSLTDTADPQGNFTEYVYGPNAAFFNYSSALEFGVWGDYYTTCWLTSSDGEHCAIIDRNYLVNNFNYFASTMILLDNLLFNTTNAYAVNTVHQGLAPRGTFMNVSAPCGLFAMANGDTQQIEWVACTAIDFLANTTTLVKYVQPSSWVSGVDDPCYPQCVPTFDPLVNLTSFANRMRTAYWETQLALAWPQANREVLWHLQPSTDVTAQTAINSPSLITSSNSTLFAPGLMMDCHGALFLEYTQVFSSVDVLNNIYTYRLPGDPAGGMRTPGVLQYTQVISPNPSWAMPQPYPNAAATVRMAPFSTFFQTAGQQGAYLHLLDQSFNVTYTAMDGCNVTQQCTQEVLLLANTPCP